MIPRLAISGKGPCQYYVILFFGHLPHPTLFVRFRNTNQLKSQTPIFKIDSKLELKAHFSIFFLQRLEDTLATRVRNFASLWIYMTVFRNVSQSVGVFSETFLNVPQAFFVVFRNVFGDSSEFFEVARCGTCFVFHAMMVPILGPD